MGVMGLLQKVAAFAQGYFFCHCERSEAISRKVVLAMRLPRSLCFLVMTFSIEILIYEKSHTIIYPTHPPRLSGFDREAQPWRVFYACHESTVA